MEKEILMQEQQHLEEIKHKVEEALEKEKHALDGQAQELLEERRTMWEEGAHIARDFDDIFALNAYDARVREAHGHYVRVSRNVRQLTYLKEKPYFGRIDFVEDGSQDAEQIYIGRYGFLNKKTYDCDIYDWRSPVASMFYENGTGRSGYSCPAGEITGEVTCKRQYQIEQGELKFCYDTNTMVQDELLGQVLSENTDKVLRVIIDSITEEQSRAIRQPDSVDLLVTGPAGSGKTSVGMHRLAYLLYHNREFLTSEKIAVLSRNQIFASYISGILPELGEENVGDVMFDNLLDKGIPGEFRKKSYYEQVEYLLQNTGDSLRRDAVRLKYSREFLDFVKHNIGQYRGAQKDFEAAVEVYLQLLQEYVYNLTGNGAAVKIYEYTRAVLEQKKLYYEDFVTVGYVRVLLRGIRPLEQISHVVLDEAQDYCRTQLLILKTLYSKSRFTIMADINQAVCPEVSTVDAEDFAAVFGEKMKSVTLHKSYRSTAPINRFAFDILGIRDSSLYMDRPGKEPEEIRVSDKISKLTEILAKIPGERSAAVITCDVNSAWSLKQQLGSKGRGLQFILKPDRELEEKQVVIPVMLAKGLEFDVVILWDDRGAAYWEENRKMKYLMCTRALHELYVIS